MSALARHDRVQGSGSSSSSAGTDSGASDSGLGSDTSANTGDAAANPAELCADIESVTSRCYPVACANAVTAQCTSRIAPAFSAAYAQALHQCAPNIACSGFELQPSDLCMTPLIYAAAPTSAQMTLANKMCQACARAPATTEGGLNCTGHVPGQGSGGRALRTSLLSLSDSYVGRVDGAHCVETAVQQYPTDYDNCENVFLNCLNQELPSVSACTPDAGGD